MALLDALLSESISKLTDAVIFVVKTTANFKPELEQLQQTLHKITPFINDVVRLNQLLDRPKQQSEMFIKQIQDAENLVKKCSNIKWHILKKFTYSLMLKDMNNELLNFFQLEVQADQSRDIKQALVVLNEVIEKMDGLFSDTKQVIGGVNDVKMILEGLSVDTKQVMKHILQTASVSTAERGKLGWCVPILPEGIVAFDEPLKKLKVKLLAGVDESSVVVVAAPGGCGKTTLSIMLCHDSQIRDTFGDNIFFVTVSETPNFMVIVNDLFNPYSSSQSIPFQSDEDAKHKLGKFLLEKVSSPMLLVLDDVWDELFIDNFPLKIKGCKILVTSRNKFREYDVFEFDPLSDQDAMTLFRQSAFTERKKRPRTTFDESLVNQMVQCCKRHPLTLRVVGRSLNGREEYAWISMLNTLSHDGSVLDLNKQVLKSLERSFTTLDEQLKECYMDFGLFTEDQRIPASALLDMWVHLYNHDVKGADTLYKIVGLSFRNLVNLVASSYREHSGVTVNYCDQQFVTQHDLLRELAIHLSSKPEVPIAHRKRLIINARGEDLPESILQIQEPMQACTLSISTGTLFSSEWGDMKVPEVQVMVLNLKSKTYNLPHFMKDTQKLKVLNVTNDGLYPTHIQNINLLGCLSNLSRIRLERVVVSPLTTPILTLKNLQKVSFIMCKMGNAFETELSSDNLKVWPSLVELEIDYCQDLLGFPGVLCTSVQLKNLSITNCNEIYKISEEFGNVTNLKNLSLRSCTKLEKLPESITRLQELSILDISDCLSLSELPAEIGKLGGLQTINMTGCSGISELPSSVAELSNTNVLCSEEIYKQWCQFDNVETDLVEEDRLKTLMRITGS